jgi:hypothetical protein
MTGFLKKNVVWIESDTLTRNADGPNTVTAVVSGI